jgi:hypothetical protein
MVYDLNGSKPYIYIYIYIYLLLALRQDPLNIYFFGQFPKFSELPRQF